MKLCNLFLILMKKKMKGIAACSRNKREIRVKATKKVKRFLFIYLLVSIVQSLKQHNIGRI